jgi:hypothetical protein
MKPTRAWLLLTALCCSVPAVALAQGAERPEGYYTPQGRYKLEGKALPKYNVVFAFYSRAFARYKDGEATYTKFLRELGMEPDTEQAEALTRALLLAKALAVDVLDLTPYAEDREAFYRVQDDWLRRQVHSLREIHGALLSELRRAGYPVDRLETYLEEKVRPGTSLTTGGPDSSSLAIRREFEEETP